MKRIKQLRELSCWRVVWFLAILQIVEMRQASVENLSVLLILVVA